MHVARAPRLFMSTTTTPACFCPVLASTGEKRMFITQRTEQHNGGRMMMMRMCVSDALTAVQ
jgi:hypothetical protein